MDNESNKIIEILFDKANLLLSIRLNILFLLFVVFVILIFTITFLIVRYLKKRNNLIRNTIPIKLKFKIGGAEIEYKIERSYQNIEIAHKIYIELITRKAAIPLDTQKDVIVEIYNSWYSLFQTTRKELKSFKGQLIKDNHTSHELTRLLTDILNKGLRPHLTEYQAKFRKWYEEELEKDRLNTKSKSPQEIQEKFYEYKKLIYSIKEVNTLLIEYSEQLKKIIEG